MNHRALPILLASTTLLASLAACNNTTTGTAPTTATVPVMPTSSAPAPEQEVAKKKKPQTHTRRWTLLPYMVTDGMESGPQHMVLDEKGKRRPVRLRNAPKRPGHSFLVEVAPSGNMPKKYEGLEDFVWAKWKVKRVLAERREDATVDWTAPVVWADITAKPSCLQIEVHVFESYTFCGNLPSAAVASTGKLLFLERDFYPFPGAGGKLEVKPVPTLPPVTP